MRSRKGVLQLARRAPKVRDTRERVLAAALAEFAARGLQGAAIEDIATRAGVTKGAMYYYFAHEDDLAADLQAQLWERLGEEANQGVNPAAGPLADLEHAFGAFGLADVVRGESSPRCRTRPGLDSEATARVLLGAFSEATLHILTTGEVEPTLEVVGRMIRSLSALSVLGAVRPRRGWPRGGDRGARRPRACPTRRAALPSGTISLSEGDVVNRHPLEALNETGRSLLGTDVVVWHTFGVTHVPRPEDCPVMPVESCGFHLIPVGFFDRNPALDVPPPAGHCHT